MTKTYKRRLGLAALVFGVSVLAWWIAGDEATRATIATAVGRNPAPTMAAKAKPICATAVNPNIAPPVNCIPQYIANLPPDPGEAGKATYDGIDADKDGTRDDVQRWIAINYGHSPIAVKRLTIAAEQYLRAVHYGDELGPEETYKRFATESMRQSACAVGLETQETLDRGARRQVRLLVMNTPERAKRASDFSRMFANTVTSAFDGTTSEACGFDVEAMAAKEGKQTIASQRIAESIERTKREQQEEQQQQEQQPEERK